MNWLERNGKRPLFVPSGGKCSGDFGDYWRWTLPDDPRVNGPEYLPKAIFDRLPGGDFKQPWNYRSETRAIEAALVAVERSGMLS